MEKDFNNLLKTLNKAIKNFEKTWKHDNDRSKFTNDEIIEHRIVLYYITDAKYARKMLTVKIEQNRVTPDLVKMVEKAIENLSNEQLIKKYYKKIK